MTPECPSGQDERRPADISRWSKTAYLRHPRFILHSGVPAVIFLPFLSLSPCAHPSLPMSVLYAPEASRRGRQCTTFCLIAITPSLIAALRVASGSGRARAGRHLPTVEDCLSAIPSVRCSFSVALRKRQADNTPSLLACGYAE